MYFPLLDWGFTFFVIAWLYLDSHFTYMTHTCMHTHARTQTPLTIWADQSHATDVCGVTGSIDSSHIPAHGGPDQVKRFPVQVNVLHKLQRTKAGV